MPDWSLDEDAAGRSVVRHLAPPRFTAYWTSGADGAAAPLPCWRDEGSGGGADSLSIYGFQWIDPSPDPAAFDRLMREAARAIDDWIAGGL